MIRIHVISFVKDGEEHFWSESHSLSIAEKIAHQLSIEGLDPQVHTIELSTEHLSAYLSERISLQASLLPYEPASRPAMQYPPQSGPPA